MFSIVYLFIYIYFFIIELYFLKMIQIQTHLLMNHSNLFITSTEKNIINWKERAHKCDWGFFIAEHNYKTAYLLQKCPVALINFHDFFKALNSIFSCFVTMEIL